MSDDPIIIHLDLIARLLEAAGYAVEVDYNGAVIIVWLDEWPVLIKPGIKGEKNETNENN